MKRGKMIVTAICLSIAQLTMGCASIVSKSTYPVAIGSTPDQADFTIKNSKGVAIHSGKTPATLTLDAYGGFFSGEDYTVTFKKDGYTEKTVNLPSALDGWYVGNLIFGGLLGILIIDPATGAMWQLPENVSAELSAGQSAQVDDGLTMRVVSIEEIPEEYRSMLVRVQ